MKNNYTCHYVYNNEIVDYRQIPPDADFLCVYVDQYDRQRFIESYVHSIFDALTVHCDFDETPEEAARRGINESALADMTEIPHRIPVRVYINPEEFRSRIALEEGQMLTTISQFMYSPLTQELQALSPDAILLEVLAEQPTGLVIKRVSLSHGKTVLSIDYPFYRLTEAGMLLEQFSFTEVSEEGETLLRNHCDQPDFDPLSTDAYIYPSGRDHYLETASPYLHRGSMLFADSDWQAIGSDDLENHELIHVLYYAEDGEGPVAVDHLKDRQLLNSEVSDVPLEHHYCVAHAYIRQLQREMHALHMEGSHYVHIHGPVMHHSSEHLVLESGQTRQHTSTFHLNGNLIVHECSILNSDGSEAQSYWLRSPTDHHIMLDKHNPNASLANSDIEEMPPT